MSSEKELRERLGSSLERLSKIRPTDLIREDALGPQLNFRAGIPFFERTLTFYRQIAASNLSRVPSAILEIAVNHTEQSLNQFEQIAAFTPAGIDGPEQVRNLLINEVREAHPMIYEDLCMLITPTRGQEETAPSGTRPLMIMTMLALIVVVAFLGYRSSLLANLTDEMQASVNRFLKH